jgi:hypothetical protein
MDELLTQDEAREALRVAVQAAGSLTSLAKQLGVSIGNLSLMRSGKRPITGEVAEYLGISPVLAYLKTGPKGDPKQEDYENKRRKWKLDHGLPVERMRSVRG